jgi:predicted DCC family thiol-disulfide oxidoreductase YuxK
MILIIYDGDCPLCRDYVRRLRLIETAGGVELVDARSGHPAVLSHWKAGFDLDQGMVALINGTTFYGAEAVHALARLSTTDTLFNRLNYRLLARPRLARSLYPLFKAARRVALFVTGRKPLIGPDQPHR